MSYAVPIGFWMGFPCGTCTGCWPAIEDLGEDNRFEARCGQVWDYQPNDHPLFPERGPSLVSAVTDVPPYAHGEPYPSNHIWPDQPASDDEEMRRALDRARVAVQHVFELGYPQEYLIDKSRPGHIVKVDWLVSVAVEAALRGAHLPEDHPFIDVYRMGLENGEAK